ncbi:MAG: cytidylate kinase family protein [Chloroflexi bacterium]|nr:cytidylate kinase family protein [Chloroflexota bacterium]MBV9897296.1 cytidylate kinase family protein [Chloroflexota bacterium]
MAVITISRHPGSLGDTIARALAERLNYRLVERAELIRVAERIGGTDVAWDRAPEMRERSPSFWERLNEERRRYASVLRRATTQLAEESDVVIVGLGGGQLLKGLSNVLRLQIIAPMDVRMERVMERGFDEVAGPLTREQARDLIRKADRDISGYMRYLFNIDWLESHHWDLVVNTGRFSVSESVDIVAAIVDSGMLEPSALDNQRLANLALASRVEATVLGDPTVWANGLKVVAQDGRVRIEGEVITEEDREAVEQIVRSIDGVRSVENDLRVQPPPLTGM